MDRERTGSLLIIFFGIYGLIFSVRLPTGDWANPGPGMFPLILSILLCVVGGSILIAGKGGAGIDWRGVIRQQMIPLKIILLTVVFILVMERVGYLLTSSFYLFLLFLWVCRLRLWAAVCLTLAVTPTSAYLFGKILGLQLPAGIWGL